MSGGRGFTAWCSNSAKCQEQQERTTVLLKCKQQREQKTVLQYQTCCIITYHALILTSFRADARAWPTWHLQPRRQTCTASCLCPACLSRRRMHGEATNACNHAEGRMTLPLPHADDFLACILPACVCLPVINPALQCIVPGFLRARQPFARCTQQEPTPHASQQREAQAHGG